MFMPLAEWITRMGECGIVVSESDYNDMVATGLRLLSFVAVDTLASQAATIASCFPYGSRTGQLAARFGVDRLVHVVNRSLPSRRAIALSYMSNEGAPGRYNEAYRLDHMLRSHGYIA